MSVTSVTKDPEALAMTIVTEFAAPVSRVWQLWADPRQLERWWGPPTYPATVREHDLSPGGRVTYWMTGPEGDKHGGWWQVRSVDAPHGLEFEDGFADEHGNPNAKMPTMIVRVALDELGSGTRVSIATTFPSKDAMDQLLAMGMEEGMSAALGQIDELLAEAVKSI
jgi:uncharacterized protein YndB with AHSA1/START domain